jgi:hypothetical protein
MAVLNVIETGELTALHKLLLNDVPSKVRVFGWRLLLAKLLTRAALTPPIFKIVNSLQTRMNYVVLFALERLKN